MQETNNILAILDNYLHDNPDEIAKEMAKDFRKRRIEKNLTREQVADKSGVVVSNITRFEQKGLISLKNLIGIAIALDYTSEIKNVFSQPSDTGISSAYQANQVLPLKLVLASWQ
jgi:transcriptional regulator with XRE-family HTH domain